jgi:hypothetical protein
MTCSTCKFIHRAECRRYPPVIKLEGGYHQNQEGAIFPCVTAGFWCGEYRAKGADILRAEVERGT